MILRLKLYGLALKAATYLLPILAFFLGWWIWAACCAVLGRPVLYSVHGHLNQMLFGSLIWAFISERYQVTSFDELFRERTGARAAWSASLAIFFVFLALLYFGRNDVYPRGLLVCDVLVLLALTIVLHAIFRAIFRTSATLVKPSRLLVVGADQFAFDAARRLQRVNCAPCQIDGFVRLPDQEIAVYGHRVFEFEQLAVLNENHGIDEAVIALQPAQFFQIPKIMTALRHLCLPARALVDLGEGVIVRNRLFQLGNIQMLDLSSTPTESLDYALVKRIFDVCFSAALLLLTAPLFALIALIIRLTSDGPIFFSQERIGLNGKPFKMYKFRTMKVSPSSDSDTQWTTSQDNRKTAFGSILRRTSLDELPQFINVLKGNMSVVGPRPERPHFVHKFLQEMNLYNHRHALKVGITGWAQVNGWRGDTSIEKRLEFDLYYLQNWTFTFDLRIILMTILSGLTDKNAY
jgi:Undecaprenyl-phosphate glucose phosphotransferase